MKEEIRQMYYDGLTTGEILQKLKISKDVLSRYLNDIVKEARFEKECRLTQIRDIEYKLFEAIEK